MLRPSPRQFQGLALSGGFPRFRQAQRAAWRHLFAPGGGGVRLRSRAAVSGAFLALNIARHGDVMAPVHGAV